MLLNKKNNKKRFKSTELETHTTNLEKRYLILRNLTYLPSTISSLIAYEKKKKHTHKAFQNILHLHEKTKIKL